MSNRNSTDRMDVDKETPPNPNPPSSPPPVTSPSTASQPGSSQAQAASSHASYTVPISSPTNGAKHKPAAPAPAPAPAAAPTNGDAQGPAPPPHGSRPSSPVPTAADEAESYKAAGNRFFKEKDYRNAIIQYTKGKISANCEFPWAIDMY